MLGLLYDTHRHNCGHRQLTHAAQRFATVCSYGQRYRNNKYNSAAWPSVCRRNNHSTNPLRPSMGREERGVCVCGCVCGREDPNGKGVLRWTVNGDGGSEDQREESICIYVSVCVCLYY